MADLIDRQAAIKAIEDLPNCYNGFSDTYDKACIIGVLEEVPSAQPNLQPTCNQLATDCISRQAAIDALEESKARYFDRRVIIGKMQDIINGLPSAQPERKTEKALRLLLKWAIECDFGYDNIPEEYEKYKDDIEGMSYTDGLIYIAMMEV